MIGLMLLQHMNGLSDEQVVHQWVQIRIGSIFKAHEKRGREVEKFSWSHGSAMLNVNFKEPRIFKKFLPTPPYT
jgi:hypothetical protein